MALTWKWSDKMGKMTVKWKEGKSSINIYDGNCLAIFISEYKEDGEDKYILQYFLADEQHCKNIVKGGNKLLPFNIVSLELNLWYKNAQKLLKILVQNGYKVKCYYKEPKQKKG